MVTSVDLNADMGESYGPWTMGDDAALLGVISSANVACGGHAGDPVVMAATVRAALEKNVAIGAHPGFEDKQNFGRYALSLPVPVITRMVQYQLGALQAIAKAEGGRVTHLKLHGALANMATQNQELAHACFSAALDVDPDLLIFAIAATAQERAAQALNIRYAAEIFADRAYNRDATLVDRARPGAVIHDANEAAARVVKMVQKGAIFAQSGAPIPARIDTICLHGDTAGAITIARQVRSQLAANGIAVSARL